MRPPLRGPRLAAIDVGSSAARITIAELPPAGRALVLWQHRYPVRLGRYAFAAGGSAIAPAGEAELVAAAHAMRAQLEAYQVEHVRAIATSALREASNGQRVAQAMAVALGAPVEIISGATEAALARCALKEALTQTGAPLPSQAVLLDLGGGSTELTTLAGELSTSLPLGTVRLLSTVPELTGPVPGGRVLALQRQCCAAVAAALARSPFAGQARALQAQMVGSGGNLHALARLAPLPAAARPAAITAPSPPRQGGGQVPRVQPSPLGVPAISIAGLAALLVPVAAMSLAQRASAYNVPKERADLLLPALMLVQGLAEAFAAEEIWVPGTGLREAVLAELAAHAREPERDRQGRP